MSLEQTMAAAVALHRAGRVAEAAAQYEKVLQESPQHPEALHGLGAICYQRGEWGRAIELMGQAVQLRPDVAHFHSNLGEALRAAGRPAEAVLASERALALRPDMAAGHHNLALALHALGRIEEAVVHCRRAVELRPQFPQALNTLGSLLEPADTREAEACFRQAIAAGPGLALPHTNLGIVLGRRGEMLEAIACYQRALELDPRDAVAMNNLAGALSQLGRLQEGIALLRRGIEAMPENAALHSTLLYLLLRDPGGSAGQVAEEHRRWGEQHGRGPTSRPWRGSPDPERRLRVGYISPDFREHSVACFISPILRQHDRSQVEVFCYSDVARPDEVTERLRQSGDAWRDIHDLSDGTAAAQIEADGIDILVDLAGHTAGNRLRMFSLRPAPVQVSYLGYPATSGLPAIGYRLTDDQADPPGQTECWHTEQLVRLKGGFLCFEPPADAPAVGALPCRSRRHVTFASFNDASRINGQVLDLWARILQEVAGSRLLLKAKPFGQPSAAAWVREGLARRGVDGRRIDLAGQTPRLAESLAMYNQADIALDTFPYNGTTTICQALWMGLPVVTLAGCSHVSRVGVSLLTTVGIPQCIARAPEEYVAKAAELAHDVESLSQLRRSLRDRMRGSPLMDAHRMAREMEAAMRRIWREHCGRRA